MRMRDTNWKFHIFTKSRPITLSMLKVDGWKYPGAQLHALNNISLKFQVSSTYSFRVMHDTNWKFHIFTKSRPVTLSTLKSNGWKYPASQVYTLNITSMKFQFCSINGLWNTNWKLHFHQIKAHNSVNVETWWKNTQVHKFTPWTIYLWCFKSAVQTVSEIRATQTENSIFSLNQGQLLRQYSHFFTQPTNQGP